MPKVKTVRIPDGWVLAERADRGISKSGWTKVATDSADPQEVLRLLYSFERDKWCVRSEINRKEYAAPFGMTPDMGTPEAAIAYFHLTRPSRS